MTHQSETKVIRKALTERRFGFVLLTTIAAAFALRSLLIIIGPSLDFLIVAIDLIILVTIIPAVISLVSYYLRKSSAGIKYTPTTITPHSRRTAFAAFLSSSLIENLTTLFIFIAVAGIFVVGPSTERVWFELLLGLSATSFYLPIAAETNQQLELNF